MEDRLVFLIGSPRSGSTLLARMLGAHPGIFAPDEPHLLTPLAHLGYFASVERAPYDPIITAAAQRALVAALPRGEADYLDALRALSDRLYDRLLAASGRRLFLDKTPAYALVLDFLLKLYPCARYVVLTRHPLAVWTSYVESFFDGDHDVAHAHNPLLERYVPAVARLLRERPVPLVHVRYEELVRDPEAELRRITSHLGVAYEAGMVEYGREERAAARGLGDPRTVGKESRPTTASVARWAQEMAGRPEKVAQARRILARLLDSDLEAWGYTRAAMAAELDAVPSAGRAPSRRTLDRYALERRLLVVLRRNIHRNALGRFVRRVRDACDVLLR
ncbi:MAG TPA: sulfotransferase [Myxococcota bacterium]|nr:sulfotransferase [Myxococcota bacterium]